MSHVTHVVMVQLRMLHMRVLHMRMLHMRIDLVSTWNEMCSTHKSEACRTLIAALLPYQLIAALLQHHLYSPNPSPLLTTDIIHHLY